MFNKLHDAVSATTQHVDQQLTDQIQELETQLKQLRENQTRNKGRQQRQLTLVGALQSALGQVVRAVHATSQAGEEELLDAFWEEIAAVQRGEYGEVDLAQLPKPTEPEEVTTEPNNPQPNGDGNGVVDVEVVDKNEYQGNSKQKTKNSGEHSPFPVPGSPFPSNETNGNTPNLDHLTLKQLKDAVLQAINRDQVYEYGPLNLRTTWEKAYQAVVNQQRPKDLKSLIQSSVGKRSQ